MSEQIERLVASYKEQMNLKVRNAVMMTISMIRSGASDDAIFFRMSNLQPGEDAYAAIDSMYKNMKKGEDNG